MRDIVIIMGAGASADAGIPVLANFLESAHRLSMTSADAEFANAFANFTKVYRILQHTAAKSNIDLYNLESLWCCLEMGAMLGGIDSLTEDDVNGGIRSLKTLIVKTIHYSMISNWCGGARDKRHIAPSHYYNFIKMLRTNDLFDRCNFITFNYDIGLDLSLNSHRQEINYGFGANRNASEPGLYKLHGSVNWLESSSGISAQMPESFTATHLQDIGPHKSHDILLSHVRSHCELQAKTSEYFIIPPGEAKAANRRQIRDVWKLASHCLREASVVCFIGFSMPRTDEFFRTLFGISTIGDLLFRQVICVDPNAASRRRIKNILSKTSQNRFIEIPHTFAHGMSQLIEEIKKR